MGRVHDAGPPFRFDPNVRSPAEDSAQVCDTVSTSRMDPHVDLVHLSNELPRGGSSSTELAESIVSPAHELAIEGRYTRISCPLRPS